jgi:hypothetical protein
LAVKFLKQPSAGYVAYGVASETRCTSKWSAGPERGDFQEHAVAAACDASFDMFDRDNLATIAPPSAGYSDD